MTDREQKRRDASMRASQQRDEAKQQRQAEIRLVLDRNKHIRATAQP